VGTKQWFGVPFGRVLPTRHLGVQHPVFHIHILSTLPISVNNGPLLPSPIDVEVRDVVHEAKDIQQPHHHENDYHCVKDRFDGSCHGNEGVDEPEKNTHHDQGN
jgi:hypothetical protein